MTTKTESQVIAETILAHSCPPPKETLYKTAKALISCAAFRAGEYVNVEFSHFGDNGYAWYYINQTEKGKLQTTVAYPSNHLTDFCL